MNRLAKIVTHVIEFVKTHHGDRITTALAITAFLIPVLIVKVNEFLGAFTNAQGEFIARAVFFLFCGLVGLISFIRGEIYQVTLIKGKSAKIISTVIFFTSSWLFLMNLIFWVNGTSW